MKENCKNEVLKLVDEVEILGHKIKMYGSIEFPWFMAKDVEIGRASCRERV